MKICRLVFRSGTRLISLSAVSLLFLNFRIPQKAHAQDGHVKLRVSTAGQGVDWVNAYDVPVTNPPRIESSPTTNAGLTIVPTFAANVDAATQTVINNVLAFYQNTFSDNLTVHIEFHNMNSGLGQSSSWIYNVAYSSYRSALAADAKTTDDATALANTPAASTNPVTGSTNVDLTSPAGRAVGLNTSELQFGQESSCPSFTGAGCIGINVSLANSHGALISVLEHEIDEVLGLGSALSGNTTPTDPELEDLFRWSSPGVRSFAAGFQTTNPCGSTPPYFSINGGTTH